MALLESSAGSEITACLNGCLRNKKTGWAEQGLNIQFQTVQTANNVDIVFHPKI